MKTLQNINIILKSDVKNEGKGVCYIFLICCFVIVTTDNSEGERASAFYGEKLLTQPVQTKPPNLPPFFYSNTPCRDT